MAEELQFMGFSTETTTTKSMHYSSFAHHKVSEVIEALLDRPVLWEDVVQRIDLIPKYAKKSTGASEKSEKCATQGPKITVSGNQTPTAPALSGTITTEQGIKINFGTAGVMNVSLAPRI